MYFDNSPPQVMLVDLQHAIRRLSFSGCEVLRVKFDSFKAVIEISPQNAPQAEFEAGGYQGVAEHHIRIVWRCQTAAGA